MGISGEKPPGASALQARSPEGCRIIGRLREESARLAFSFATAEEIEEGVGRLAELIRQAARVAV